MYRFALGIAAGVALTLVAGNLFLTHKETSRANHLVTSIPIKDRAKGAGDATAKELALLQRSLRELNEKIDRISASSRSSAEAARSDAGGPKGDNDTYSASNENDGAVALKRQAALNKASDFGMTLPDFMESAEFGALSPEAKNQVMEEVVRRFNDGEIDREHFLPGYKKP